MYVLKDKSIYFVDYLKRALKVYIYKYLFPIFTKFSVLKCSCKLRLYVVGIHTLKILQ